MSKIWFVAAICAACLASFAWADDTGKGCGLQIPESGCQCEQCVNCTKTDNCGNCQDTAYVQDGCIGIPVAVEDPRVIDPNCCGGSTFCLLDATRGQYTMCCPGGCYELLNQCHKDLCPDCKEKKCSCNKCESKCGCEKKACGCKQKSCGCEKKECGCKSKCGCQNKCGGCGSTECGCYTAYTPASLPTVYQPKMPQAEIYIPIEETPEPPIVEEQEEVIKVEGRG
jgi:hypothetical protein